MCWVTFWALSWAKRSAPPSVSSKGGRQSKRPCEWERKIFRHGRKAASTREHIMVRVNQMALITCNYDTRLISLLWTFKNALKDI